MRYIHRKTGMEKERRHKKQTYLIISAFLLVVGGRLVDVGMFKLRGDAVHVLVGGVWGRSPR